MRVIENGLESELISRAFDSSFGQKFWDKSEADKRPEEEEEKEEEYLRLSSGSSGSFHESTRLRPPRRVMSMAIHSLRENG